MAKLVGCLVWSVFTARKWQWPSMCNEMQAVRPGLLIKVLFSYTLVSLGPSLLTELAGVYCQTETC